MIRSPAASGSTSADIHTQAQCSNLDRNRHSGETAQPSKKERFLLGIRVQFKSDATGLVIVVDSEPDTVYILDRA